MDVRERIMKFSENLPEVKSVKAYGSSIGFQSGYKENEKKQIDLIVIVDDIKKFYEQNLIMNKYMYNFIPRLYFKNASKDSLRSGASICYTSHIDYNGDTFKMGVIEKEDVIDDLLNWKTFYIAGRFQKEMFTAIPDYEIEIINEINKKNALTLALLLLDKENANIIDLYEKLCSLSYTGDSRKRFKAEDPNKVKKIAIGSKDFFDREYKNNSEIFYVNGFNKVIIDYDLLFKEMITLPNNLKESLSSISYNLNNLKIIREEIINYLTDIIKSSSTNQTLKGILTTGPINSVDYAFQKLKKGRKK